MANIAATDITVTKVSEALAHGSGKRIVLKLVFGDSSLTYGAGGVPISKGVLGCPNDIQSMKVFDKGTSVYEWTYDKVNEKLIAMQSPARTHAHDVLIKGGQAAAANAAVAWYATDILGKEIATDKTIAKADTATKGGVISETLAAAGLTEPSAVAIAAQTLHVEVIGW